MQMPKTTPITIQQAVDLSLTENHVPPGIHGKQYDHGARRIGCSRDKDSMLFTVPVGVINNVSGTRSYGDLFQYSSEAEPAIV